MNRTAPVTILLVEDDPADQKLVKMALKSQDVANDLYAVNNAEEALDFLHSRGEYSSQTTPPNLILLDLNMPGMGGKEFLKQIKADDELKRIPVVVLTVSQAEEDILKTYNLHANCYITKPVNLDQFLTVVKSIEDFWLTIVKLPPNEAK